MKNTPYWLDDSPVPNPPLETDHQTDVLVIGGGICGSAALLSLAQQGIQATLIEARDIGHAATGRNAGFILQGTAERYSRAIATLGHQRAKEIHQWSLVNHNRIEHHVQELGIDCGYLKNGSLQLANSIEEEKDLEESMTLLLEDGFKAKWMSGNDLGCYYQESGFQKGLLLEDDGELHPVRYVRGLIDGAKSLGAKVYGGTSALSIQDDVDGATVQTAKGLIRAQIVLVCTNAYTPKLLPWFKDKIDPVRGQMLATAPAPPLFDRPIYADHGYDYWRQDEKGCLVLGGWRNLDPSTEVGFTEILNDDIQSAMTRFVHKFPRFKDIEITHRWSGIMGFSVDGLPILGSPPGSHSVLAAAGFTGHGFGFAQLAGEALVEVALKGSHPFVTDLSARRFI